MPQPLEFVGPSKTLPNSGFGITIALIAEFGPQDGRVNGVVEFDEHPQPLHGIKLKGPQYVK